jgi:hypothetical protein
MDSSLGRSRCPRTTPDLGRPMPLTSLVINQLMNQPRVPRAAAGTLELEPAAVWVAQFVLYRL